MKSIAASERLAAGVNRPGLRAALSSLLPTGVFLVFDGWLGLVAAMIAASATTLALLALRRRRGDGVGILLPLSLGFVVVKAVAGVVTESQVVYFGAGLALTAFLATAVGATAFMKKPVASYLIPLVTPYRLLSSDHPVYRRVSAQVTAVWALAELGITSWEAWHLTLSSASEFVVARSVVAWPVMGIVIFMLIFFVRFRLDRYEHALASRIGPPVDSRIH
ncbi:MAG: hypothetical protein WBM90_09195 [Acidimicrobiia bacterium]